MFTSESFFGVTGSVLDFVRAQVRCEAGVFSSGMLELGTWRGAVLVPAKGRRNGVSALE